MDITLTPMTRPLCHAYFRGFENDPDIFMDMTRFAPYEYTPERADQYKVGFTFVREDDTFRYYVCRRPT